MSKTTARATLCALVIATVTACRTAESPEPQPEGSAYVADMRTLPLMRQKLGHAHGSLDALTLGQFGRLRDDAQALVDLSQAADWLVHETTSYRTFSEQFREAAQRTVERAEARDLDGASIAYADVIRQCVACHHYLRTEGLYRDVPGRLSHAADSNLLTRLKNAS